MSGWFRSVLYVVLDAESPADGLAEAARVAEWFDASLDVQTVLPEVPRRERRLGLDPRALARSTHRSLERWADAQLPSRQSRSTVAAIHIDNGRMPAKVVARVLRGRHDLVIVSPSANTDRLASARRLARVCPCPLLVRRRGVGSGDVLVAVDPDDRLELNVMLLAVARDWSRAASVDADIVHAFDPFAGAVGPFGTTESAAFVSRVRAAHAEDLDALVDRLGASWVRERAVVQGRPADVIIETAATAGSELIVVGTAGRRMSALLIGNTADRVLSRSDASVLIVKPPGFVPQLDIEVPPADEASATAP